MRVVLAQLYSSPVLHAAGPDSACLQIKHYYSFRFNQQIYVIELHINATNYCILNRLRSGAAPAPASGLYCVPLEFVVGVPCSFLFLSDEKTVDADGLLARLVVPSCGEQVGSSTALSVGGAGDGEFSRLRDRPSTYAQSREAVSLPAG
jgi:hypothetical protein